MLPSSLEWLILGTVVALIALGSRTNKTAVTDSKARWAIALLISGAGAWDTGRGFYTDGDFSSGVMLTIFTLCLCLSAWGLIRRQPVCPA